MEDLQLIVDSLQIISSFDALFLQDLDSNFFARRHMNPSPDLAESAFTDGFAQTEVPNSLIGFAYLHVVAENVFEDAFLVYYYSKNWKSKHKDKSISNNSSLYLLLLIQLISILSPKEKSPFNSVVIYAQKFIVADKLKEKMPNECSRQNFYYLLLKINYHVNSIYLKKHISLYPKGNTFV